MTTKWNFEAEYFTFCNCDWGCPCNFNARPTQGNCHGVQAWRIRTGTFGETALDGVVFVGAYFFPGLIEEGNGTTRYYVDEQATPQQRQAIEAIASGTHGGGILEVLAAMTTTFYPLRVAKIDLHIESPKAWLKVEDILEGEADALSYPDGTVILPSFTLPHGIEFKAALATNAKKWWIRDEELLASHRNTYAAVTTVKLSDEGCVG
jgi:hypothetical protein